MEDGVSCLPLEDFRYGTSRTVSTRLRSSQAAVLVGVNVLAISVSLHHTNQERSSCRWRGSSEPNSLRLSNFTSAQCTYTTEK